MKSRWKQVLAFEPDREYLVLASWIPPRSRRSTVRLFHGSRAVAAQLSRTEGLVGFSMLARPLRRDYATISVWVDDAALARFATAGAHAAAASELAPEMAPTTFVRWTVRGDEGRPSWKEALDRLGVSGDTSARA